MTELSCPHIREFIRRYQDETPVILLTPDNDDVDLWCHDCMRTVSLEAALNEARPEVAS